VSRRAAPRLLWPLGIAAALLLLAPLLYLVVRASQGEGGLGAMARPDMWGLVGRSLGLALAVGLAGTALALLFALVVEARDLPARRVFSVLVVLPLAVPCYVGASAYVAGLSPIGPFGALLGRIGVGPLVLEGFGWATLILTVYTVPLAYLPIRAAIARADGEVYDAARTLGRGRWSALACTLRGALPRAVTGGAVLVVLYTLGEFGAVALLRYDAFPRVIYLQYLSAFDRSAAALSSLMLVGVIATVLALAALLDRGRHGRTSDRARPLRFELGGARWAAASVLVGYLLFAVVVPVGSIAWWLSRGAASSAGVSAALGASAHAAALALGPAVLIGTAVAVLGERTRRGAVLARFVDVGFALPGLVVALGLTFLVLRSLPGLYQGWVPYSAAMVILFCPLVVAAVRGALAAVPPSLEDAARTLGASPTRAFWRVTMPLLTPGLLAGGALVSIATMKELSASLLLLPAGTSTLATRMWGATEEARYAEAALPALLLIGLAAVAALVAHGRRRA
jgi:iron(III) transport system permease protein